MAKKPTGTEEVQPELDLGDPESTKVPTVPKGMAICSKCPETGPKNQGQFPRDKSKKSGYSNQCKTCRRQYRKDNAVALAEQRKKYRARPENRFKTYKESAASRGYTWNLSNAEFMELWQVDCVYCGVSIETIGIDRVNPALPYQADNIESCCSACNRMKSDLTRSDFLAHITSIFEYSG